MKDFYHNTRSVIDNFNLIQNKILTSPDETTQDEEELLDNFCVYLAHALIKDTGTGQLAREELVKVADIINIVVG